MPIGTDNKTPVWARGPVKGLGVQGKCRQSTCEAGKSQFLCVARYESSFRLKHNRPQCPVCNECFDAIRLYFLDCDLYFTLQRPGEAVNKQGPFHCPNGEWSVIKVSEIDAAFTVVDFKFNERPPELKENINQEKKKEACQTLADQLTNEQRKIVENFSQPALTAKQKLEIRKQQAAAKKVEEDRARRIKAMEHTTKRIEKVVADIKPGIAEAKSLADLDKPAAELDLAKKDALEVVKQRDAFAEEVKTQKAMLAKGQIEHNAIVQQEEKQLKKATKDIEAFREKAKAAVRAFKSFFSRTFGEATKYLSPSLEAKVEANAGVQPNTADREHPELYKQIEESRKFVEDLLGSLQAQHEDSIHLQQTLQELRALLLDNEKGVNDLTKFIGQVLVNLDTLDKELGEKMGQLPS